MQLVAWSKPAQAVENPFLILPRNIAVIFTHHILPKLPQELNSARSIVQTRQRTYLPALSLAMTRKMKRFTKPSLPPPHITPLSTSAGVRGLLCVRVPGWGVHARVSVRPNALPPRSPAQGSQRGGFQRVFRCSRGGPRPLARALKPPTDLHTEYAGNSSSPLVIYCVCCTLHSRRRRY